MTGKTEERHAQLELCIPFVFGRLNPGNRKQFEAHLATGCEQCRAELAGLYEATGILPLMLRQEAPPSGVRQRLLNKISSKRQEPPRTERERPAQQQQRERVVVTPALRPERPWYLYASIALGVLLIVALVIFVNQLVGTTGSQEKQIAGMEQELAVKQEVFAVLKAGRMETVPLMAAAPGSGAYGKILWDPAKRSAILQVADLAPQPEGKQYQLWLSKEKKYVSAGVFDVTAEKSNLVKVLPLPAGEKSEIEGFVITLEPKGGSPEPTSPVQLRSMK